LAWNLQRTLQEGVIEGGGFRVNGRKIEDPFQEIEVLQELKIQLGKKRFYRLVPKKE